MWKKYERATLVNFFADVALFLYRYAEKGCDRMGHTDYVHMDSGFGQKTYVNAN